MSELQALRAALKAMAAAESQTAVNNLLIEVARSAAKDAGLPLRRAIQRLDEAIPKMGDNGAQETLAAIGRLEGWDNGSASTEL